ncbi:MAG: PHP domain-containing protein, partial [Acidobacteria bacterium]|nr:PHP domain-containing protein [Acidobacteriota bacterium]
MRILRLIPSLILIALSVDCSAASNPIVLHGTVKGDQNNSYIEAPFDVPPGTERLTVSFRYTGKEKHTTLDIGIEDPQRFRGWSGGNKSTFTIGASDATPSYLPG